MKELYIETKDGYIPIDKNIIEKYDLVEGIRSPFTDNRIIDKKGSFHSGRQESEDFTELEWKEISPDGFPSDEVDQMNHGFEMSTSEMIDFAQGVDSD
ncbi:MAG: hypothetical protein ACOX4P_06545 [Anaerovoracaceae bacterium]|jgi:hypothetical protein